MTARDPAADVPAPAMHMERPARATPSAGAIQRAKLDTAMHAGLLSWLQMEVCALLPFDLENYCFDIR